MLLVKNIALVFENMVSVPVNTSLKAFDDLVKMKFDFVSAGKKAFVTFNLYFDSSVDNSTACSYANDIIQEFLTVYGYNNLELLWGNSGFNEGMIWVHRAFGYIPYALESASTFLKYKPTEGFARFINSFLENYVFTGGLLPSYTLEKIGSNFYWTLEILGSKNEPLKLDVHEYSTTIHVKEMLNTSSKLIEEPSENQRIIILIEKNRTLEMNQRLITYTINIKNISPEGFGISPSSGWFEARYEPIFPMEDIVIEIIIDSQTSFSWKAVVITGTVMTLTTICIIVFYYVNRKSVKEVRKSDEKKQFSVLFLISLVLLTPLTNTYLFRNFIQQPKVTTQSFIKTIDVKGRKFDLIGFGKVTEYSNGTKLVEISIAVENISLALQKMRINFTKTVIAGELDLWKSQIKKHDIHRLSQVHL